MQPPPRTTPPGASGPPPPSGGPNSFRRNRPHKHGAASAMTPAAPSTMPVTDPFAFGRQNFSSMAGSSQAPPTNSNPLPMQSPPLPGFNPTAPPQGPPPGPAQAASPGPPPRIFTPQPVPSRPGSSSIPPPAEAGYFSSQEPIPYIAQLPNPAPPLIPSTSHPPSTTPTPPVQSQAPFHSQPTPPLPSHWVPEHGSRPPSVQNYFQPTSDLPSQPFQAQAPHPGPSPLTAPPPVPSPLTAPPPLTSPLTAPPLTQSQNQFQSAQPNVSGPAATYQQNSHFPAHNYFSQSGGPSEPWFNQNPQDPSQRAYHVPYSEVPSDSGTLSMFFGGNDVENEETLTGEGRVNGIHQPLHSTTEFSGPYLNDSGNIRAGTGPSDSVENLECVPNQEVLPSEPPPSHAFEGGPNLETPDSAPRLARSASVSSSYSNVSHSSGHGAHSGGHVPRRQQVVGTFIQQESPRPPDHPPLHPSTGGYFEQIDSNPAAEASPTFPTPSPPKPVGVFQASANSSFEPVRSHGVGVRPAEVDRARVVMEKGGRDMQPGNLEHPPDNLETIYLSERRPSSRAQGARRPIESPATALWAQNDTASLSANILLAPAAPSLTATFVPAHPSEVIQPPEDGPLDLHPARPDPQPPSENLEIPPDSTPQASLGYASLLVTSPPEEALNQPVLIAPPSSNYSLISSQNLLQPSILPSPQETAAPVHPHPQSSLTNQMPQNSPPTNQPPLLFSQTPVNFSSSSAQGVLNLTREANDGQAARPNLSRAQSLKGDSQFLPPSATQAPPSSAASTNHNQPSNYQLLDFSMHQPQSTNQVTSVPAVSQSTHPAGLVNNTPGFYLQVTKDAQQGGQSDTDSLSHQQNSNPPLPSSNQLDNNQTLNSHPPPPPAQNQPPPQAPPTHPGAPPTGPGSAQPPPYPPQSGNSTTQPPQEPQRPPSSLGSQSGYGVPPAMPPGPGYPGYYPGAYPEYQDGRVPYPPQYPVDPRTQNYYQDDPYRRGDPRYGWYDGQNPGYREAERQPERPSSRTSQYSDRPSSRQGYQEDFSRSSRSAYDEYYANYYKRQYDAYGDRSRWYDPNAAYDPRYKAYYDQMYGWYYNQDGYRGGQAYYNQQYQNRGREGYDDPWRYYPGYDSSFDDDSRRRDPYADDFDRRSVHSEQSAHSVHSSHSRRSSFSSRSQQSQVYRSQPDLVSAAYDATGTTLPADYTYSQYPNPSDTVNYGQDPYNSADNTWSAPEQPPPRPLTPEKFSIPHRCARFGPAGQLILVQPNLPSAGQPTLVEIHSMETLLQDSPEQSDMRSFPGPLVKEETHKVDVMKFAQNKAQECLRNDDLIDKDSAYLIWEFIVLLCRQNGTVVGTDIADLLLKEHRSVWLPGKSPNEANLIDFNNEAIEHAEEDMGQMSLLSDTFMGVPENIGKDTERFRELLLFGRKKDALESAMKNGLWGHALLLASKMDNRTHARVMTRFANSLPINDPLQTVYQLMSGRMPAAATCCGDEKWGDWRPHLAMVLSNLTHTLDLDTRTISTMGDTLASKGLVDAAHFCYLMAQVGFGVYTKKSTKMVLISSNHSLPFLKFCSSEAIQRTESYEYAQSLGSQPLSLPNFQVFKFIYACRLAESGLCAQAFHYCEVISRTLLSLPEYYSPVFISQLIQMSLRLRFFDPQLKERPEQELFIEPDWLLHLRQLDGQIKEGVISLRTDRSTPQLYPCSTPSSEDQCSPPEPPALTPDPHNALMTSLVPPAAVQLMPPAPPTILQDGAVSLQQVPPPSESVPFYPVAPGPPQPNFVAPYQPEMQEQYMPMPPQIPQHMPPQMPTYNPAEMPPQMPQGMPGQMPPPMHGAERGSAPSSPQQFPQPSPTFANPPPPGKDFYDEMARLGPGRRSRTTSQSSMHMAPGRRSRTTSESSNHSGRERSSSFANQGSPPPPPIPEAPPQDVPERTKKDSPKKGSGGGLLTWLFPKRKNEAHLPDDKNKSIVWDEKKQKWVNLDEPEEESKPPPPPPTGFPKAPMSAPAMVPPGVAGPPSGPPVNMFSRRAGTRSRYVDVLNPGRGGAKAVASVPPPADLFAPLAPMAMPANLFTPAAAPDEQQPMEGSVPDTSGENTLQTSATVPQMFNPNAALPPGPEGTQSGELSRSSSMSSLSREVSQHLNQAPAQQPVQGAPPAGGVTFYNPSQFAQSVPTNRTRPGRLGQRGYPTPK
ncbi:protein transport protein Sec16A isoform X2 [Danio rerio]|uniref:Protein transport protein sec16 n=1 Tax=Danio rerio TaxID=7955 RepID=A0A8M3AJI6_DANRE|nr:protein transport protein Sec16A isoform X2 [Danio rerio]|eukprot:XP_009290987.1 protein transport protein Sec16A isoform X2 [Danio rerio]